MTAEEMTLEEALLVIAVIGWKHDNDCYEELREMAFDKLKKMPVRPSLTRSAVDMQKLKIQERGKDKREKVNWDGEDY